MYAVIETGGKQYKVQEGDVLFIEKLANEEGSTVTFDKVVAVSKDDKVSFGTPFVSNASVTAKCCAMARQKDYCFQYKPRRVTEETGPQTALYEDTD